MDTSKKASFEDLVEVMDILRTPEGGCPWDLEQDWSTLRQYIIEEAFELVEAIDSGDRDEVAEECGDLLFQVVFLSRIAKEEGWFDVYDTITSIRDKLIRRHPHVFADVVANTPEEVLANWDELKKEEKAEKGARRTLDGVPSAAPSLLRAHKIGEKAARVGFDWDDYHGVMEKLSEEVGELTEALAEGDPAHIAHEYGDVFFVLAQLGRHVGLNPEDASREACERFRERFYAMEDGIHAEGKQVQDLDIDQLEERWQKNKSQKSPNQ